MPRLEVFCSNISDEIDNFKSKLALLVGDKKAYYESCCDAINDCKKRLMELRKENDASRIKLRNRMKPDDHIINQAFQSKSTDRAMLVNKSTEAALETMDGKVCYNAKKLNILKHTSLKKKQKLDKIQTRYQNLFYDSFEVSATFKGINKEGQILRGLENRLDKAKLKCGESDRIRQTYKEIIFKLEADHLNYGKSFDAIETEIKRCRDELRQLRMIQKDAESSRKEACYELKRQEDLVFTERRRREMELGSIKQKIIEKQIVVEKVEKRVDVRDSISNIEEDLYFPLAITDLQQKRITEYEAAFKLIQEATGVSDLNEVLMRFENQGYTMLHLEKLQNEIEKSIVKLQAEKEILKENYAEMHINAESKQSSNEECLEDYNLVFKESRLKSLSLVSQFKEWNNVLVRCKSGIEHLGDMIGEIEVSTKGSARSHMEERTNELVSKILENIRDRIPSFLDQFKKVDIENMMSVMIEEETSELQTLAEFHAQNDSKIPANNIRIKIPQTQNDNVYEDEEDSGDDETNILTRKDIKIYSKHLLEVKTKKRNPKKKKKLKTK